MASNRRAALHISRRCRCTRPPLRGGPRLLGRLVGEITRLLGEEVKRERVLDVAGTSDVLRLNTFEKNQSNQNPLLRSPLSTHL